MVKILVVEDNTLSAISVVKAWFNKEKLIEFSAASLAPGLNKLKEKGNLQQIINDVTFVFVKSVDAAAEVISGDDGASAFDVVVLDHDLIGVKKGNTLIPDLVGQGFNGVLVLNSSSPDNRQIQIEECEVNDVTFVDLKGKEIGKQDSNSYKKVRQIMLEKCSKVQEIRVSLKKEVILAEDGGGKNPNVGEKSGRESQSPSK